MAAWIIFYEDGSTFSDEDGEPADARKDGVVVVIVVDAPGVGRRMLHSADFYCWQSDGTGTFEWVPHNQRGLDYYLSKKGELGIYVAGYTVVHAKWQAIYEAALSDPRMPFKTGWDWREAEAFVPPADRVALEASWVEAAALKVE